MEEILHPVYHHETFSEKEKSKGFVKIISPLKGEKEASNEQETRVEPVVEGTIPIHADYPVGASITARSSIFVWNAGADDAVKAKTDGKSEEDGAFLSDVDAEDELFFESIGGEETEAVSLDASPK
ncbi:MAG: hypothetical protein ALECFALPRED_008495 [Alectoria fallacina]|uniref:Uncharacterized protein n=1 Tax=Alectoria fallacina TaxID=1903189 RepID=A0A8H3J3Z0_9LECA|nr:MAG: hypothetical protein ALECFALPRED_008495 [Alectoria fallacina]